MGGVASGEKFVGAEGENWQHMELLDGVREARLWIQDLQGRQLDNHEPSALGLNGSRREIWEIP